MGKSQGVFSEQTLMGWWCSITEESVLGQEATFKLLFCRICDRATRP